MEPNITASVIKSFVIVSFVAYQIYRTIENNNRKKKNSHPSLMDNSKSENLVKIVVLGCGCSGATPLLSCILGLFPNKPLNGTYALKETCSMMMKTKTLAKNTIKQGCLACQLAYKEGKLGNKNKRNNPSILISSKSNDCNVLIDVCKTFREGAFDIFLKHEVKGIDAVIISHEHADATFGFDDIRLVSRLNKEVVLAKKEKKMDVEINVEEEKAKLKQRLSDVISEFVNNENYVIGGRRNEQERIAGEEAKKKNETLVVNHPLNKAYEPVLVHCTQKVHDALKQTFPYLFVKKKESEKIPRYVSQLEVNEFTHFKRFEIVNFFGEGKNLGVIPFPVWHGKDFVSSGFIFGERENEYELVYISDVSLIPPESLALLKKKHIKLFFVDCLQVQHPIDRPFGAVHFDLCDALATIQTLKPEKSFLLGMGHSIEYEITNEALKQLNKQRFGEVACLFDGMVFDNVMF